MSPVKTLVSGPQALKAAESLRRARRKDDFWPYDWQFAPPGSKMDQATGFVAVPAQNIATQVVSYQVPDGMNFYPLGVVLTLIGANYAPGDFTWSLTINSPVGISAAQFLPYDGFQNVPFGLGTLEIPWALPRADRNILHARDTARIVVTVASAGLQQGSFAGVITGYVLDSEKRS